MFRNFRRDQTVSDIPAVRAQSWKTNAGLAIILPLLLAGCSTPIPQALAPQMQPQTFATAAPDQAKIWPEPSWWQGFGDPQLTSLVGEAQTGNRDIAIAAARVLQAEAQSTISSFARLPVSPDRRARPTMSGAVARARAASTFSTASSSASL